MEKKCRKCNRILDISGFHRDRGLPDGHRNICKDCAIMRTKRARLQRSQETDGLANVLHSMKSRCYYPQHKSYARYGGRGIKICDAWMRDENSFYSWCKSHGHRKGLQLDRIDNDAGYTPSNCRFVTPAQNQHNTGKTAFAPADIRFIRDAYENRKMTQRQIASLFSVHPSTISMICSGKTWRENSLCLSP